MSIQLEPNKGLRLKLDVVHPIRTWHGGGNFWSHEFQQTVRQGALANFLPRAIEDDDSVLFEHRVGGEELASTSVGVTNMKQVPQKALDALQAAVAEFKSKADDPHCDRTKRQMIESFRLPDPQKDRDLYRLIGKGSKQQLLVLWGVEREEGSALSPGAAVDLMHTPGADAQAAAAAPAKKSKLVPALLLIALLAAGGWFFWQHQETKKREAEQLAAEQATAARLAEEQEADRIAAFNTRAAGAPDDASGQPGDTENSPPPTPGTVIRDDETGDVTGVVDDDGQVVSAEPGTAVDKDGKVTASSPGTVIRDDKGKVSGVVGKDGKVVTAEPGKIEEKDGKVETGTPGSVVRDSKGTVTGVVDKDGKVTAAKPGTKVDKDGKITASPAGTVVRDSKGVIRGVVNKDGKFVGATPGKVAPKSTVTKSSSTGSKTAANTAKPGNKKDGDDKSKTGASPATANGKGAGTSSKPELPTKPGTIVRNSQGKVTGVVDKDGKVVGTEPGKVADSDSKTATGTPGTLVRKRNGAVSGVYDRDGKIVNATPGTNVDKDGKIVGDPGSSVVRAGTFNRTGTWSGTRTGAGNGTGTGATSSTGKGPANSTGTPAAPAPVVAQDTVATPMTTKGPPPVGVSSLTVVSTSLSGLLASGNVEVLLNVVARDEAGSVINAPPIKEWRVNGEVQTDADGPVLPLSLSVGTHSITTIGTGADGKPFQTDAEVDIRPKQ